MPKKPAKKAPTPMEQVREDLRRSRSEYLALKAGVQEVLDEQARLRQRIEKVEVAVGKAGSVEMPPNVERDDARTGDDASQPGSE